MAVLCACLLEGEKEYIVDDLKYPHISSHRNTVSLVVSPHFDFKSGVVK